MSLIHWWPLNGNLNDQGILSLNLNGQGSIGFTNSGKIGKGASFTSDSHNLKATDLSTLTALTKYSMSCWVYLSNTATNHSSAFLSSGNWNSGNAQVCFGLYSYSSGYSKLLVPNKSGWADGINLTTKIQLGIWHHYAIVYDGSTTKGYIDGIYIGSYSGGGISSTDVSYYYLGAATYYSGFTMKGTMNDFRIYDHALSTKEVKEISKGLVLHYTFEDEYVEPTTNIDPARNNLNDNSASISGMVSSGGTTVSIVNFDGVKCYKIEINKDNISSWFGVYLNSNPISQGASVGQTVTRSVMMYVPSGQTLPGHFTESIEGNSTNKKYVQYNYSKPNTWQKVSLTGTIADTGTNNYLHYLCAVSSGNVHLTVYLRDFQMEIKDHATPYVNGTRSAGKVYDSSGYGNNGTIVGDCQIISQTNSGIHSLFNNSTNIGTSTSSGAAYIKGTLVSPWSPEQLTISFWSKIIDYHYQNSGILSLSNNSSYPNDYTQAGVHQFDSVFRFTFTGTYTNLSTDSLIETNVWHHYVLVYNGSSVISYRDGIKIQEVTGASGNVKLFQYIYLGLNVAGGAWRQSKENWADFKLYSTALSADDIKAEYNRKAAIDKNGNLFSGEFIETGWNSTQALGLSDIVGITNNSYIDKTSWVDELISSTTLNAKLQPSTTYYIRYKIQRLAYPVSHSYTTQVWAYSMLYNNSSSIGCAGLSKEVYTALTPGNTIWVTGSFTTPNSLSGWRMVFYSARWSGSSSDWGSNAELETVRLSDFSVSSTPFTHENTNIEKTNIIHCAEIRETTGINTKLFKSGEIKTNNIEEL